MIDFQAALDLIGENEEKALALTTQSRRGKGERISIAQLLSSLSPSHSHLSVLTCHCYCLWMISAFHVL